VGQLTFSAQSHSQTIGLFSEYRVAPVPIKQTRSARWARTTKMSPENGSTARHRERAMQDRRRKTGAVDQDGNVVSIPRLPSVTGASKPPGWDRWSPAEKVQHLLGLSLDRIHEYLSWPADALDPYRLAAQLQAARVITLIAAKAGMQQADHEAAERSRQEFLQAILGESEPA
jgi:hypothetical protein